MNSINLCDNHSCTQCHACELTCPKHCISFKDGEDGFSIPVIDRTTCVGCGLCVQSCHQLNLVRQKTKPAHTYAAWSLDDKVRTSSSSGGVFTEIARYVFDKNGVVFGAVMDVELKVRHTIAESMEQLIPMRGSKYIQSDLSGIYLSIEEYLKSNKYVLFTGTPCQVAGLYAYLKKDYDNLLTCDLVCHGVPSQKSFDIYCEKTGLLRSGIIEVSFRYTKGWGLQMATRSQTAIPSRDGDYKWKNITPKKSYYLRAFTRGLMFNEACYNCKYATPRRISDITLADYWGIGGTIPFNHSRKKGVSLLIINSEKGRGVVCACKSLYIENRPFEEAVKGNHNLSRCSERPRGRDTYCDDAGTMTIKELSKKYGLEPTYKDYIRPLKRILQSR